MIFRNKKIIFITGDKKKETAYFAKFVLKDNFSVLSLNRTPRLSDFLSVAMKDVIIIEDNEKENPDKIKKLLNSSSFCIFVITEIEKKARIKKILPKSLESFVLVLDFSIAKKLKKRKRKGVLTFGVDKKGAAFYITDIHQKENETNFKVNYGANTIPFWIKGKMKIKEVYGVLPALCLAKIFNLNLAEVSNKIREKLTTFTEG